MLGVNVTDLSGPDEYNPILDEMISDITSFVLGNYGTYKWYGQSDCTDMSMWQIMSALLFALTVVTSIGYGHVFPVCLFLIIINKYINFDKH